MGQEHERLSQVSAPGKTWGCRCRILLGAGALLLLPLPLLAQANDAAYCADLAELARRYAGSPGGAGDTRPDRTILEAIDDCDRGNTAAGIKRLEQKLRSNGFTLPRRSAPA